MYLNPVLYWILMVATMAGSPLLAAEVHRRIQTWKMHRRLDAFLREQAKRRRPR